MIADRYPTPYADDYFGRQSQIDYWMEITKAYAVAAANDNHDPAAAARIRKITPPPAASVATREITTGHEVVAFLSLVEDLAPEVAQYVHLGLTSSDLVEFALCRGIEEHTLQIRYAIDKLLVILRNAPSVTRLSRTHGQVGWLTNWHSEMGVTAEALANIKTAMRSLPRILKTPGPSGVYSPVGFRGFSVGADLNRLVVPATQVLHRDHLLTWATHYLRLACTLENLALQVRLGARSDVGEVREGAADSRAGSSAMPHKKNPITSEKVCGLARVARGYFMVIAEGVALWESRDLSNSSAERVAVAGLAGVVEHMIDCMEGVMDNLVVDEDRMARNIQNHDEHSSYLAQYTLQTVFGVGPVSASESVREDLIVRGDCPPMFKTGIRVNQAKSRAASEEWRAHYPKGP